jgi:Spy/CpxP family protein refolding chaperone
MKTIFNAKLPALLCGAFISLAPMASLVRAQDAPPSPPPGDAKGACDNCDMMKPGGPGGPGGPGDHHPGGNPMEVLSKRLNLTEDQKAKIKPILDEGMPQMKAIHEEAKAKMKTVMDGIHDKIKPLLDADQQQKLEELKKQMENGPRPDGPGQMGGPGKQGMRGGNFADRLTKELNLTPEQQTQIKPILEDTRSQMKALHEDTSLAPDQKKAKGKEIRDASNAKIKAFLTPDQQKKMDQMKKEHGPGPGPGKPE